MIRLCPRCGAGERATRLVQDGDEWSCITCGHLAFGPSFLPDETSPRKQAKETPNGPSGEEVMTLWEQAVSEDSFEDTVIELAMRRGWRVHAERRARTKDKWVTPIKGHKGYVDLTMVRQGIIIFAELKSHRGRLRPDQKLWLAALEDAKAILSGTVEVYVWRPKDWAEIEQVLT